MKAGSQNKWRREREEGARESGKQAIFEKRESYLVAKEGLEDVVRESDESQSTERWKADALKNFHRQPR